MNDSDNTADAPGTALHRFAVFTAAVTFVLIFVGGLVTSTGSALAVPDWPLSFGKLFPRMEGGVLYEHGHRMVAGTVAILTASLMVWALRREARPLVRRLAVIALALVVFQAVLGGLTVLLLLPLPIAVAHAATAQAFFCLVVALALLTNPRWDSLPRDRHDHAEPSLPVLAAVTTAVVYLQILVGAVMRHMGAGLAIPDFPLSFGSVIPPLGSLPEAINFAHRVGALIVTIVVVWTIARVLSAHRDEPLLRRPAILLAGLLVLQLSLGALTIWTAKAVIPTTAHVAVGAAVLVTSLTIALRSRRLFARASLPVAADSRLAERLGEREVTA